MVPVPASIEIPSLHTPEMIREEMEGITGRPQDRPRLTMGAFLRLWLDGSPFIHGGEISEEDLLVAQGALGAIWSADQILQELACACRALEIIPGTQETASGGSYTGICPEWVCDIYSAVCQVSPSTSWEEFLNRMPLVLVFHLVAACSRHNGNKTARPSDWTKAFQALAKPSSCQTSPEEEIIPVDIVK